MIDVIIFTLYDSHGCKIYAAKWKKRWASLCCAAFHYIPHHPFIAATLNVKMFSCMIGKVLG